MASSNSSFDPLKTEVALSSLTLTPFALGNVGGGLVAVVGNALVLAATLGSNTLRGNCNLLIAVLAACDLVALTSLTLTPFALGDVGGGLVAVVGNALVLAATLGSNTPRGNCNLLIAVLAACDLVSGVCFIQQALMVLTGNLVYSLDHCGRIWSLLFFSLDMGSGLILSVGLDRLLSLGWAVWYKSLPSRPYLISLLCISAAFGASVAGPALTQSEERPVVCIPPTSLQGGVFMYWVGANLMINLTVVVIYIFAFRRAKELRDAEAIGSRGMRAFRKTEQRHAMMVSLVLVVQLYICSWLATMAILALSPLLPIHPRTRFHVQAYCGWLVLVNVGSNAWIYAWRSELYRRAMLRQLRYFLPSVCIFSWLLLFMTRYH